MSSQKGVRPPDNSLDSNGEFPLGAPEYFFYLMFQAARRRDLYFGDELAPIGLDLAQWRTLAVIRRLETCTMSSLARYSTVERTTLTRAVDQLVGRGIVKRWVPDSDRRQVNLALTDQGEDLYAKAVAILQERNRRVLEGVDPKELRSASRVLQRVLKGLTPDEALALDLVGFGRGAPLAER